MDSGGMVFKVAVFALIGLALYYFYKWLNGSGELTDVVIYTNTVDGLPAYTNTGPTRFSSANSDIPMLLEGGEYSFSTWVYISNWTRNTGQNKPFFTLSGGGGTFYTTIMYLGQNIPKLGIRTSAIDGSNPPKGVRLTLTGTTPEVNKIRPESGVSSNDYTDGSENFKVCDIESIDLQRWVNITVVLSGRTQDVYIDGKMSRSCVLPGMFLVDGDQPTIQLGGTYGFGGLIGTTKAANFAYSPDQVYKIYQNGPLDTSIWTKIKSYFDPSQYSFSIKKNGTNIVSGSTA
jgi:hypothetical protein